MLERYFNNDHQWSWEDSLYSLVACVFLAATAGYWRLLAKVPVNPVLLPTAWALFCMLGSSLFDRHNTYNASLLDGFAVGAYVGMSSLDKLRSFSSFAGAGFAAGAWIVVGRPFCLGFGGKSGFTAMLGVVSFDFLLHCIRCRRRQRGDDERLPL